MHLRKITHEKIIALVVGSIGSIPGLIIAFNHGMFATYIPRDILKFVGETLLLQFLALFIVALMALLVSERSFKVWRTFALWYIPLGLILSVLAGNGESGFGPGPIIDGEGMAILMSGLFVLISLGIFGRNYLVLLFRSER